MLLLQLHVETCIPAIVENSVKKGEIEYFCIPSARDRKALLEYEEYIRKNLKPSVTNFFVNRKGKSLEGHATYYISHIGRRIGVKDLSVSTLRAQIETENFLDTENSLQISAHLGHKRTTAAESYVSRDKRHEVVASLGMLRILEEHGERAFEEMPRSSWDPV